MFISRSDRYVGHTHPLQPRANPKGVRPTVRYVESRVHDVRDAHRGRGVPFVSHVTVLHCCILPDIKFCFASHAAHSINNEKNSNSSHFFTAEYWLFFFIDNDFYSWTFRSFLIGTFYRYFTILSYPVIPSHDAHDRKDLYNRIKHGRYSRWDSKYIILLSPAPRAVNPI